MNYSLPPHKQRPYKNTASQAVYGASLHIPSPDLRAAMTIREAAYVLLTYVTPPNAWEFDPPFNVDNGTGHPTRIRAIELGSGTGIVGHAMRSAQPAPELVVATDLPEVCYYS